MRSKIGARVMARLIKRFIRVFGRHAIDACSASSRNFPVGKLYLSPQGRSGHLAAGDDKEQLPLSELAERLAEAVYRNEIRYGGWAIDVGLLGSSLFVDDAAPELQSDGRRL